MDMAARDFAAPEEVTLSKDKLELTLDWGANAYSKLSSETLRRACRCAWCRRDRILGSFPDRFEGVGIADLSPFGAHALHVVFSDGHARGVFPWAYLATLKDGAGASGAP